jgi:tripartite-type tricarboxylate transporter receptor subunit TctC
VVAQNDPANSFNDLAKESQSTHISYGSGTMGGGSQHVAGAIATNKFKNVIHVPYKSGAEALAGIFSGSIRFVMDSPMTVGPLLKDNKLRALAVLNSTRVPEYNQVPTFAELGINDYQFRRWLVLLANSNADPTDLNIIKSKLSNLAMEQDLEKLDLRNSNQHINNTFLIDQHRNFKKIADNVKLD